MSGPNQSFILPENYSDLQIQRIQQRLKSNGIISEKYWIEHRNGELSEIIIRADGCDSHQYHHQSLDDSSDAQNENILQGEHGQGSPNSNNNTAPSENAGILQDGGGRQSSSKASSQKKRPSEIITDNMILYEDNKVQFQLR